MRAWAKRLKGTAPMALLVMSACAAGVSAAGDAKPTDTGNPVDRVLWYAAPAVEWAKQCLPIGNSRLGAMIYGGTAREHIQFNEESLWFGDEESTGSYQPFGDLKITLGHESVTGYRRELDLTRALHRITYESGGVHYRREYFSSHPAQVMVFHFTADQPGAYTGQVVLEDAHNANITAEGHQLTSRGSMKGLTYAKAGRHQKGTYHIHLDYEAQVRIVHQGGTLTAENGVISFDQCDSLTFILAAGTDYLNQRAKGWKGPHPHERLTKQIDEASKRTYAQLKDEHVSDYQRLFNRFAIDWGKTPAETLHLPTDERMKKYKGGSPDPDLEELVFEYARYLMISSSRPGSLPANLQGLWNNLHNPMWHSDYHTNINLQMNYWFTDRVNLSECFKPLAEWIEASREVWRERTKKTFNIRGWVLNPSNGIFGGRTTWNWQFGDSAWLAQSLYDHYAHTQDKDFLQTRAYPVIKELCETWEDRLKALPDGTLVSPNGFSPEHGPTEDGVSYDQQLIWDLFTNFIEVSEVLGKDEAFRAKVANMRERLLGPRIGKWGQLQEWMVDRDKPNDDHRHLSHLIAVHPGRQIAPATTPELAEAARTSLNARGDGGPSWSKAWKISLWARLHDGDRAYKLLGTALKTNHYDNLFSYHPPFQIDGNFGYASGVCEMLLQSHLGRIHLLPALPAAWPTGSVRGLRARGGYEVDMEWKDGRLVRAVLKGVSNRPGECIVQMATAPSR
jgi:alpha-L-fucosidase 2